MVPNYNKKRTSLETDTKLWEGKQASGSLTDFHAGTVLMFILVGMCIMDVTAVTER